MRRAKFKGWKTSSSFALLTSSFFPLRGSVREKEGDKAVTAKCKPASKVEAASSRFDAARCRIYIAAPYCYVRIMGA